MPCVELQPIVKPRPFHDRLRLYLLFLNSYGQTLTTSTFIGETSFAILIAILGLVLFAHLIGNMQPIEPAFASSDSQVSYPSLLVCKQSDNSRQSLPTHSIKPAIKERCVSIFIDMAKDAETSKPKHLDPTSEYYLSSQANSATAGDPDRTPTERPWCTFLSSGGSHTGEMLSPPRYCSAW
ncbi:hypothetical protein RJ639_032120 [Escallonia herrerae]|uniref:Uncharacterized protein n=1 Tax=Escallonia herrerae TaxID=1293975 RepID=A0AA89BDK0_9ASTE|nr:hypothetical protein RJ639_032120 [Escallonia herrerae]